MECLENTPLSLVAQIAKRVTEAADRIAGDRFDVPLLVNLAVVRALAKQEIQAQVMYGPVAWIEVLLDHSVIWSGCWGKSHGFWVATQFGETVDLNASASHRKRGTVGPGADVQTLISPPMLWTKEVPAFFRYEPVGVAAVVREDLIEERDLKMYDRLMAAVDEIPSSSSSESEPSADLFPNEPIACTGRRILDDSKQSFRQYDRALAVRGIPPAPF